MPETPAPSPHANAAEIRRWNDDRWTSKWPQREVLTEATRPALMAALDLGSVRRAVEIGSGSGRTAVAVATLVGPGGSVVGVDVSHALTGAARDLAEETGVGNTTFTVADAQTAPLPGGPFDLAFSKFGVMFFDEPVTAFANILDHLRPGGRLVLVCWQSVDRNPWHTGSALEPFVPPPALPGLGKSRTGPFTLGDSGRTASILESAGFEAVAHDDHELVIEATAEAVFDRSQLDFYGVPAERQASAMLAVDGHLARFHAGSGRYRFPLAFTIYQARRPAIASPHVS